jgi:multiple sugar transport system substrate-binding protein
LWLRRAGTVAGATAGAIAAAACSRGDTSQGAAAVNTKISGTVQWSMWANDALFAIVGRSLELFRKQYPAITVEVDRPGAKAQFTTKFQTLVAADTLPDAVMQDLEHLTQYGALGVLADLKPFIAADKLDTNDFFESALKAGQRQGKQVGLPRSVGVAPVYYNKRHLQERGIAPPAASWTWDDLVDMARKLTFEVHGQQRWGFGMYNEFGLTVAGRIWQNGGEVLSADEKVCLLDQKPAVDAIQWWYDLATKWHVAPTRAEATALNGPIASVITGGNSAPVFLMAAQWASMGTEGTWSPATFAQTPDLDWDMQSWPVPKGGKPAGGMTQNNLAVTTRARAPDAAWALVKFLTGKEVQQLQAVNAQWCPPRKSVIGDPVAQQGLGKGKNAKAIFTELEVARPSPVAIARWPDVNRYLGPALTRVYDGEPASAVLPAVVKQINDTLRQPPA